MFQHARPAEGRRIFVDGFEGGISDLKVWNQGVSWADFFVHTKGEPAGEKGIKRIPHFDPRMIHDHDPQLIFARAHREPNPILFSICGTYSVMFPIARFAGGCISC